MRHPQIGDRIVWSPRPGCEVAGRVVVLTGAYERNGTMTVERDDGLFFRHLRQRVLAEPFWRFEEAA